MHAPGAGNVDDLCGRPWRAEPAKHFGTHRDDASLGNPSLQHRVVRLLVGAVVAHRRSEQARAHGHLDGPIAHASIVAPQLPRPRFPSTPSTPSTPPTPPPPAHPQAPPHAPHPPPTHHTPPPPHTH